MVPVEQPLDHRPLRLELLREETQQDHVLEHTARVPPVLALKALLDVAEHAIQAQRHEVFAHHGDGQASQAQDLEADAMDEVARLDQSVRVARELRGAEPPHCAALPILWSKS